MQKRVAKKKSIGGIKKKSRAKKDKPIRDEPKPEKRDNPTVIRRRPERCPRCDTLWSLKTYYTTNLVSGRKKVKKCERCGHKVHIQYAE